MNTTLTAHEIQNAILRGERVYHYQEGPERFDIDLPNAPLSVTNTQQISYAKSKAEEIVKALKTEIL
ncbi:MAG: hypothetical protein JKY67_14035 [Pseudomonadales bacterium]|nr:hypothetical protein [Pseudomonadales bacterium]